MTCSSVTRSAACVIACAGLSIFTRGAAAQIMPAPATPNATSGGALTDWNITYRMPANWRVGQTIGRLQMIVSNTEASMIFLGPVHRAAHATRYRCQPARHDHAG